jgi:hypothetical protein
MMQEIVRFLDNHFIEIEEIKVNLLSYSIFLGKDSIFLYLLDLGCNLENSEVHLERQGINLLEIISARGHSEILAYYLPIYLKKPQNSRNRVKKTSENCESPSILTAIRSNHLNILSTIYEATKRLNPIPEELNFFSSLNNLGENSALLACRIGNYHVVKYLHSKYPMLLLARNKQGDNAIHIACCGSTQYSSLYYLSVFEFLIGAVGLDISENYLKSLITLEDPRLLAWFEDKLNGLGNDVTSITSGKYLNPVKPSETLINISNLTEESNI